MSTALERPRAARRFLPAALIIGAALLAYRPALTGGYVWDDAAQIVGNRDVRSDGGLLRIWSNRKSLDFFPLTYSMHWVEWRLFRGSAVGPHVINVLLHGLSAVLLWQVLLRLKVPGAWLAGLLFALHPVAVASAAWLSERKNTLSMVFYLGSLLAYLRFNVGTHHDDTTGTTNGTAYYIFSLGLFLLALLSKSSVAMLPVILLLLAWWRRAKVTRRDLLRTIPFFALSLALGLVTVWFQRHNAIGQEVVRAEGAASRIAAAGWIVWFYLCKILLPVGLCAVYPRWEVDGSSLLSFLPIALLCAATALLWANRKRWGAGPLVAWAYFVVTLLPVLGFVDMSFMRLSLVADHLQYAAMPGILALAAALLARATAGASGGRPAAVAAAVAAGICLAALGAITYQRAGVFTGNLRLWRDNVEKTPNSARAWCEMGLAYSDANALDEAIVCFDKALALAPKFAIPWCDRGNAFMVAQRYAEAIHDYDQAIALAPDYGEAWFNRGAAYAKTGRNEEALRDLDRAEALRPDYAEVYITRGNVCMAAQRYTEAIGDYDQAVALKPDDAKARFDRGTAYARAGRLVEALRDLDRAIALRPDYAEAYGNRGNVHMAARRCAEAIADYSQALACNPRDAEAWYNRANAYLAAGRPGEAVRGLDQLIALRPREARAYLQRAIAHQRLKQNREALADLQTARQLGATAPEELLRSLAPSATPR